MQEQPKIGQLVEGNPGRDAIHIAIAPVVAGEDLEPSQRVGLDKDGKAVAFYFENENIGIVDPYLDKTVRKGQQFYLFLFPNTVTSLRHVWTHNSFKPKIPTI